jgi:hypothetical protein
MTSILERIHNIDEYISNRERILQDDPNNSRAKTAIKSFKYLRNKLVKELEEEDDD